MSNTDRLKDEIQSMLDSWIHQPQLKCQISEHVSSIILESHMWANIVISVHSMLGGQSNQIHKLAAVTELMMVALNLMDDYQDGDLQKHSNVAIDAKDSYTIILSLALLAIGECKDLSNVAIKRMMSSIQGQHIDLNPVTNTESEYFEMIQQKSGSLMQFAIEIGTYQIDLSEQQQTNLRNIGSLAGMYQQLQNDMRDVIRWDEKNDLLARKKTFPIHYLLEQAQWNPSLRILEHYYNGDIDFEEVVLSKEEVWIAIKQSKVREATIILLEKWKREAERLFLQVEADQRHAETLKKLLFPSILI